MPHIEIISSSVRTGRKSNRVAEYFRQYLTNHKIADATIIDLKELNLPLFDERLRFQENPSKQALELSDRITRADGVIIVFPEYNGGYPASLKNFVDLLYQEWKRKPVALAAVSSGAYGGTQGIISLQFTLWKIGAWTVPARFHVSNVEEHYHEDGTPADREHTDKLAKAFIDELMWCVDRK